MDEKKHAFPENVIPVVSLGGKTWFLRVTHKVLERFSAISRCPLAEFDAALARYDSMVLLLWLMVAENRPDITRNQVEDWLQDLPVMEAIDLVTNAVGDAINYSFPKAKEDREPETEDAPADPTGAGI